MAAVLRTVLIVDDDEDIRTVLSEAFADDGYGVACASDGYEALAQIEAGYEPSLILLDLMMPKMDGWQFRAEQQKLARHASVPVIIMTAGGRCREAVSDLAAQECVTKPFSIDFILATARRWVVGPLPIAP